MFEYDDFGPMILTAREDLSMSQKQLAILAQTPLTRVVKLEAGIPGPITLEQLLRVLRCVGLEMRVQHSPTPRPTYDDLIKEARTYH